MYSIDGSSIIGYQIYPRKNNAAKKEFFTLPGDFNDFDFKFKDQTFNSTIIKCDSKYEEFAYLSVIRFTEKAIEKNSQSDISN